MAAGVRERSFTHSTYSRREWGGRALTKPRPSGHLLLLSMLAFFSRPHTPPSPGAEIGLPGRCWKDGLGINSATE